VIRVLRIEVGLGAGEFLESLKLKLKRVGFFGKTELIGLWRRDVEMGLEGEWKRKGEMGRVEVESWIRADKTGYEKGDGRGV